MKLGISSYSLLQAMNTKELTPVGVLEAAAAMGAEHVEIVPLGFPQDDDEGLVLAGTLRDKAQQLGLELSNYAVGANFSGLTDEGFENELARLRKQVDIANALGVKKMRHDVAFSQDVSMRNFMSELPRLAEACRRTADYAASYGITTSVENHGYYIQHSDRVQALIDATGRDNFRMTLDIGNFVCVDEDPAAAVRSSIGFASMIHVKDFYRRPAGRKPSESWFPSAAGRWLRGAIVGQGDLDIPGALRLIKQSGYDGFLSIEFEGMEECVAATRAGLEYVRQVWNDIDRERTG